jgi:hypothetical protein
MPKPFRWKAPTFSVAKVKLSVHRSDGIMTVDERARIERFMEAVVEKACSNVQARRKEIGMARQFGPSPISSVRF